MSNCAYCEEGELVGKFGIKIAELAASKVYLFREQSHRGRVIVASKRHVSELVDLERRERQAFMDDVAKVASALHKLFNPEKVNYGAYGDTCGHLHFHLVPKYAADAFEWGTPFAMDPKRTYLSDAEYADLVATIKAELAVGDGVFDLRKALERIMIMWCESLGAQWCYLGEYRKDVYVPIYSYAVAGETPLYDENETAVIKTALYNRGPTDFLAMPDFKSHPLSEMLTAVSPHPEVMRQVSSSVSQ